MNDLPRRKLVEIVAKHGTSVVENPRRCEALLRDYCGEFRREISVLTMALEERVPLDLLAAAKSTPQQVLFGRLTQKLCDSLALSEHAARWSVHSWALALGLVTDEQLSALESLNAQQTQTVTMNVNPPMATSAAVKTQSNEISSAPSQTATAAQKSSIRNSYVVSARGGDFSTIGEAIRSVSANTRLIVRPGIYNESIVIDKNLEIVGDGLNQDIVIVGEHASCLQMRADKALVRNLSLRGQGATRAKAFFAVDIPHGALFLKDCDISSDSLSCVAIHGASSNPTLENCRIHNGADSGVYFFDNARGQIVECDIYRNRNANAAIAGGANPMIKNSRIFNGNNGGVVAWQNGAAGTIEDCKIFGHRLANVGISEYANPTIRRCEIASSADAGVFVQGNGYGTFEECDVHSNEDAEVAVSTGGNSLLRRCRIHNGNDSGVVVREKGRALLENCDVYDNRDAGISVDGESVAVVRRSNVNRNGTVAVRVKGKSAASVEDCDLRGNRVATWESEYDVIIERKNNRE